VIEEERTLPRIVAADGDGPGDLADLARQRQRIEALLAHHGALLFRGYGVRSADGFAAFVGALCTRAMDYVDRGVPRTRVHGRVFTATDYPGERAIFFHNEQSFGHSLPSRLFFCCARAPESGGETPLADVRRVYAGLDPALRERFARTGVLYVRNLGGGLFGLRWQAAFQTESREELEAFCARAGIELEWLEEDRVRTRQVRPAVGRHPRTGEPVWLNHAAALHPSTLEPRRRATLERMFAPEDMPNDTRYGDGSAITEQELDAIRRAYAEASASFSWQESDVLVVDNLLVAHARNPYRGPREVWVSMADPVTWSELAP
jgi:alpha-ketoglutarate-dependent taurine dioxygenase